MVGEPGERLARRALSKYLQHHTMNKAEAAKYLQIGVRTLERHTSEGRLQPGRVRTKTGLALDYDVAQLERFKAELEAEAAQVLAAPPEAPQGSPRGAATLARVEPQVLAVSRRAGGDSVIVPIELLARLAATLGEAEKKPRVATVEKLLLDLAEAQALTGLSRAHLRAAIQSGALAGKRIGRGWKVRRDELERWVKATC